MRNYETKYNAATYVCIKNRLPQVFWAMEKWAE
jgi:hypothetical protein